MSCRWLGKPLVRQGPAQLTPAGYAGVNTFAPSVCHELPASVLLRTPALPKANEPKLMSPVAA